jgi:hypothetical protein
MKNTLYLRKIITNLIIMSLKVALMEGDLRFIIISFVIIILQYRVVLHKA